jgi:hypothetical protein
MEGNPGVLEYLSDDLFRQHPGDVTLTIIETDKMSKGKPWTVRTHNGKKKPEQIPFNRAKVSKTMKGTIQNNYYEAYPQAYTHTNLLQRYRPRR